MNRFSEAVMLADIHHVFVSRNQNKFVAKKRNKFFQRSVTANHLVGGQWDNLFLHTFEHPLVNQFSPRGLRVTTSIRKQAKWQANLLARVRHQERLEKPLGRET